MDAHKFRAALRTLNLKQTELADLLQLGRRTVRHYAEGGVTNAPTMILINLLLLERIDLHDIKEAKCL